MKNVIPNTKDAYRVETGAVEIDGTWVWADSPLMPIVGWEITEAGRLRALSPCFEPFFPSREHSLSGIMIDGYVWCEEIGLVPLSLEEFRTDARKWLGKVLGNESITVEEYTCDD